VHHGTAGSDSNQNQTKTHYSRQSHVGILACRERFGIGPPKLQILSSNEAFAWLQFSITPPQSAYHNRRISAPVFTIFAGRKRVIQAAEEGICDVSSSPEDREGAGPYRKFTKRGNTSRCVNLDRIQLAGRSRQFAGRHLNWTEPGSDFGFGVSYEVAGG
jgi:hypothetical protein